MYGCVQVHQEHPPSQVLCHAPPLVPLEDQEALQRQQAVCQVLHQAAQVDQADRLRCQAQLQVSAIVWRAIEELPFWP